MPQLPKGNLLFYGDNLPILKDYFPDECVDLIYLDPPFNSKANYNILFKEQSGEPSQGQIKAFTDTWQWSELAYEEFLEHCRNDAIRDLIEGFVNTLGRNAVTAYLVMMASRLQELHRVLKSTGSLYLHCDPTASHYLKLALDCIFGPKNFRNEIIWKRTSAHSDAKGFGRAHDVILYYLKSNEATRNKVYQPYTTKYIEQYYRYEDPDGRKWMSGDLGAAGLQGGGYTYTWKGVTRLWRLPESSMRELENKGYVFYTRNGIPRRKRYLDESNGYLATDIWDDIEALRSWHQERLGYPTQKPQALLERIIEASSKEGGIILDPFCGCGTAVAAAHKLKRKWIGIDVTHLAIALIQARLRDTYDIKPKNDYKVIGVPEDATGARELFSRDTFEFQKWAVSLIPNAYPTEKKGADEGIDGRVNFTEHDENGKAISRKCVIQVKGGKMTLSQVRDFAHVIEREKATMGLFISLQSPTEKMIKEADKMGFYKPQYFDRKVPRYQILTVEELLAGKGFEMPPTGGLGTHGIKRAKRAQPESEQGDLELPSS